MSDKVIRRIPTASAAGIQADQRSSHIISSCIDIMDQSDVEAAMKKSESDTELLSGNVINYSLNTLTRSNKISNLEKTDEEDVVKLREKQGRSHTLVSKHINQTFEFLNTYKMETLEESTIISENDFKELLKKETENDNSPLASNNNTCENTENHSLPQSKESDSIFRTDDYRHNDIVKTSEKSPNEFLKDSNTNFTVATNHTDCQKIKEHSVTNHGISKHCHAEFNPAMLTSTIPDYSENVNENCSDALSKAGDESERLAVEVNSETALITSPLFQEDSISDLTVESDTKTLFEQQCSIENFTLQRNICSNVASPLYDMKHKSGKSNTSSVEVCDPHSENNDCSIESQAAECSENCDNIETCEEEVNLKSLPSSMSDPSVKSLLDKTQTQTHLIQGGMSLRRGGRRTNPHLAINSDDDSSDDDDSGIYAESTRNSAWLCVSDDGTLSNRNESPTAAHLPSISDIECSEEEAAAAVAAATAAAAATTAAAATAAAAAIATAAAAAATDCNSTKKMDDNDEYLECKVDSPVPSNHIRSESNATTVSETSFRRQFLHRNKKVVLRKDSQTEYQRFSAKFLECEETVRLMKESEEEFGLHILDSHPTIVTLVDPGSPAERSGIRTGHILVSINNINVLESSLEEIIKLIQQSENKVSLTVGLSNVCYSRDLEAPLMTGYMLKLGNSHLPLLKRASWRKRWFVLRKDNCLYYYKSEKEDTPLGAFPLANYCISRYLDTNKDYCFKAEKYGARTYYFMTESREDMNRWVEALQIAAHSSHRKDSWLDVTSHNVGIPALEIKRPDCTGYLYKMGLNRKVWRRRYCILKDACVYYYKNIDSISAKGVAHFHGYEVDDSALPEKKYGFVVNPPEKSLRTFYFNAENETDKRRWVEALRKSIGRWIRVL